MGAVYLACSRGPGRFEKWVALKVIHEHLCDDPAFVEMFLDEARLGARLRHPNVVTCSEVFEHDRRFVLALDYVEGQSLAKLMTRLSEMGRTVPLEVALLIVAEACEGLTAIHQLDIIHRDVSPQNVMIGYDGSVRIMDFGIAKTEDSSNHTAPGIRKGKAAYMAPEQHLLEPYDARVDIFALGVVLWELLAGRRLFAGESKTHAADRVIDMPVPRLSGIATGCDRIIDAIVQRALSKDPKDRFASARELATALRSALVDRGAVVDLGDVATVMEEAFPKRERPSSGSFDRTGSSPSSVPHRSSSAESLLSNPPLQTSDSRTMSQPLGVMERPLGTDTWVEAGSQSSPETSEPARRRANLGVIIAASLGAVLSALLTSALVLPRILDSNAKQQDAWLDTGAPTVRKTDALAESRPREDRASVPAVPAREAPEAEPVRIAFRTTPVNARILADGQVLASDWVVPSSLESRTIVVTAPGYASQTLTLRLDVSRTIDVVLAPLPTTSVPPKQSRAHRPKKRAHAEDSLFDADDI